MNSKVQLIERFGTRVSNSHKKYSVHIWWLRRAIVEHIAIINRSAIICAAITHWKFNKSNKRKTIHTYM